MTLSAFLLKLMASRVLAALAVLAGVLQIIDLLEVTTQILDRNLGPGGVAYYAMLRIRLRIGAGRSSLTLQM